MELDLDQRNVYRATLLPAGLAGDGPSQVYQTLVVPAGRHDITVRMRDTPRTEGFDHEQTEQVTLSEDQMFVIDYQSETGKFVFR